MVNNLDSAARVFIVVLNFNNWRDTVECLDSLLEITYKNYSIVIVDNDSNDGSPEKIVTHCRGISEEIDILNTNEQITAHKKTVRIKLLRADKNGGYGYGNNLGIKYALSERADYVLIINNDTIVDPDFLQPLVNTCEDDKTMGIVSGKIYYYDKPDTIWSNGGHFHSCTGKVEQFNFNEKDNGLIPEGEINFISGCMWFIPVDVIREVGYINEEYFMYMEDIDYCHRVLERDYKLAVVPESRIFHKAGDRDKSFSKFSVYWRSRNYMILLKRTEPFFFNRILKALVFNIFYSIRLIKYMKMSRIPDQLRGMLNGSLRGKQKTT